MGLLKRITAALGGGNSIDEMVEAYPEAVLDGALSLSGYPQKSFLGAKGICAYRLEFMVSEQDGARVVDAIASEFEIPSRDTFQDGPARNGGKSIHFSLRPEFGGAVVVIVTNSVRLIEKIDALHLQPPPPWIVFPCAAPATLGSLQGSLEYWWDWLFLPFWSAADTDERARYLANYPASADWIEFLATHAP
jgi:hypothetical protein